MEDISKNDKTRLAQRVSRAVGVPDEVRSWYISIVRNNTEKSSNTRLKELGYETYLPVQEYISVWKDGRKKKREQILIPNVVFIKLTEKERLDVVNLPYINYFMVDKAAKVDGYNRHPVATVPDEQIKKLQFMLGQNDSEVMFDSSKARRGDMVKVVRGSLAGLEGILCSQNEKKSYVVVELHLLGNVKIEVSMSDLVQIK